MKRERAIAVGQDALIWLAGEPEALERLPRRQRPRARRPSAPARASRTSSASSSTAVLASDARVLAFAAEAGLAPEEPARARATLGGGEPHWT